MRGSPRPVPASKAPSAAAVGTLAPFGFPATVAWWGSMLGALVDLIARAWWTYPLILVVAGFDVIVPALPSEALVITAGILAARGDLHLALVIAVAAVGAFAGDNLAYWIGHNSRQLARRWILRGPRGERALDWARRALAHRGGSIVVIGRFIPGGRTASALGSGILEFPYPQFMVFDGIGAASWAAVNTLLGYLGGLVFRQRTYLAFAFSFGIALALALLIEAVRRLRAGHGGRRDP